MLGGWNTLLDHSCKAPRIKRKTLILYHPPETAVILSSWNRHNRVPWSQSKLTEKQRSCKIQEQGFNVFNGWYHEVFTKKNIIWLIWKIIYFSTTFSKYCRHHTCPLVKTDENINFFSSGRKNKNFTGGFCLDRGLPECSQSAGITGSSVWL